MTGLARFFECLAFLTSSLVASRGAGEPKEPQSVVLVVDSCIDVDPVQLRNQLTVELGLPVLAEADSRRYAQVRIECVGDIVKLETEHPDGRRAIRQIPLQHQPPESLGRFLALIIAETLLGSRFSPQLEPSEEPAITTSQKPTNEEVPRGRKGVGPFSRQWDMRAGFVARKFVGSGDPLLLGAGLQVLARLRRCCSLGMDALVERGTNAASIGSVATLTLSSGISGLVHARILGVDAHGGVGARLGFARLDGRPSANSSARRGVVQAAWSGPYAVVGASILPASPFVVGLQAEVGYVLLPVGALVDGTREIAIDGFWSAGFLLFGVRL